MWRSSALVLVACLAPLVGAQEGPPARESVDATPMASQRADPAGGATGGCGAPATGIHHVQGHGASSPLQGEAVVVEGVVVGDFQGRSALQGFFVQEEDGDRDGDPATSEAVFVFNGDGPFMDVAQGDIVRVAGTVEEFSGSTQLAAVTDVSVCGSGGIVAPTELTLPLPAGARERVENMRVTFPQDLVISEYFDFDRFGEIVLALPPADLERPFQPTAYAEPGSAEAAAIADAIGARRITLDDGRRTQNPAVARHPNGDPFTLDNRFRGGDRVRDAAGVLHYAFDRYRVQPTTGAAYTRVNPRPEAPEDVGGDLTVATLNVYNYFTTLDDGANACGPRRDQACRGADDAEEFARQEAKLVAALAAMDADVVGLIEVENGPGVVRALADALNRRVGAGTYAAVETGPIGPDAIKVAFLYQPGSVTAQGRPAVLDTPAFLDPNRLGEAKNRPALAQSFAQRSDGAVFTAVVTHLKSKGSACGPGDDDPVQGNCHRTRTLAARELLSWLGADPTDSGDPDVLLLSDLNAYDEEDPVRVLEEGGFTDLGEHHQGEFAYTFVFDGRFGHLDYALANASLARQVTGATHWHVNADEPDILDYDTTFKSPAQRALFEANAFRASDHDPVLVGLDLTATPTTNATRPKTGSAAPAPPP